MLTESLGERRASRLLGRILKGRDSTGIDALKWMDPRTVAEVIKNEHPQIVATILAHLPSQQAADVLRRFDAAVQADIALRVARLDEVPESALQELDAIVERQTKEATSLQDARLGGVKAAAEMINLLGASGQTAMIDAIKAQADQALGEQIKDALFVFDNLLKLDDRGMQAILREVQADVLSVALKGADEEIKEKIFKNMSKRAAEILRDDIAAKGPVRLQRGRAGAEGDSRRRVAARRGGHRSRSPRAVMSSFDALADHRQASRPARSTAGTFRPSTRAAADALRGAQKTGAHLLTAGQLEALQRQVQEEAFNGAASTKGSRPARPSSRRASHGSRRSPTRSRSRSRISSERSRRSS